MKKVILGSFIIALVVILVNIATEERQELQDVIGVEFVEKVCEQYTVLKTEIKDGGDYNAVDDSEYDSWYSTDFFVVANKSEKTRYEHSVEIAIRNMSKRLLLYKEANENGDISKAEKYLSEYRSYEEELVDLLELIRDRYTCVELVLGEVED